MPLSVPTLPGVLVCLNTSDWSGTIPYSVDGQPRQFAADTTITGALKAVVDGVTYKIQIEDITIDIATGEVTHRVPKSAWAGNPLAVYDWAFTENRADGVTDPLLVGKLKLAEGPEA